MEIDPSQAAQGVPVEPERLSDWRRYCVTCGGVVESNPETQLAGGVIQTVPKCPQCGKVLAKAEAKQGA